MENIMENIARTSFPILKPAMICRDISIDMCTLINRDQLRRDRSVDPTIYNLKVHIAEDDDSKPLQISHVPQYVRRGEQQGRLCH